MTTLRIHAIPIALAMIAVASAQMMPFQNPGEIAPGIDIKFIIRHAGMMWNQPRALDSLAYACEYVLPVVSGAVPEDGFTEQLWSPFCDPIVTASNEADPDTTALCSGVWAQITDMISQDMGGPMGGRLRRQAPSDTDGTMEDGLGDQLLSELINATKAIYGVDPLNPEVLANSTIICGAADRFLLPSVPDQVIAFMKEVLSGVYLDLAKNFLCDNWSNLAAGLGDQTTFNDIADLGAKAMGFDDRTAFCGEVNAAILAGVTARKALATNIVTKQLELFTKAAPCKQYTDDVVDLLKQAFPADSGIDIDAFISGDGLNQYTGFSSIDEICDYMGANFDASVTGPGSKGSLVSMNRYIAGLMTAAVVILAV